MVILKTTQSICPKCFKKIDATIFSKNGSVFMKKFCKKHGLFEVLLETDEKFYRTFLGLDFNAFDETPKDIMIPVTSHCNLSCNICYLPYKSHNKKLGFLKETINNFDGESIHLSGGEPTLRKDLLKMINIVKRRNKQAVLITNGLRLEEKDYVNKLKKSGLDLVSLPLNSLNNNISKLIEGSEVLESKLKALDNLKENKIGIILGSVLIKGINDSELESIFDYCLANLDHIVKWRIKIGVEIGRNNVKDPLCISQVLKNLCLIIKNSFGYSFRIEKIYSSKNLSCKLNLFLIFLKKGKDITLFDLKINIRSYWRSKSKSRFFSWELLRRREFKKFLRCLWAQIFKNNKIIIFPIEIRRWPTKFTLDLNELKYCRSLGLAEDGKVYPFCYSLILNERIINQKSKD